jgi:hypothetical protein
MNTPFMNFGWNPDPREVERVLGTLPMPLFGDAAPHLSGSGAAADVFFWELEEAVLGRRLVAWNQSSIGSCVSHGTGRAVQDAVLVQCALGTSSWPGAEVAREPIYGGSRVEVGGQRGSYQDGSVGAWAAKYVNQWGVLLYRKYDQADLSDGYNVQRCKKWGAEGVPDALEPTAKLYPVKTVSLVESVEQARDAIANGYPLSICGSLGRTMKRQAGGFCPVSGSWSHCQELCGVCVVKGGRPAFVYRNSWGDYLGSENNRVQLESGREIELPDGCYLSDFESVGRDLRERDTFSFSGVDGYPANDLPKALFKIVGR